MADPRLLAWGRSRRRPGRPPPLWLFTDERRLPDPLAAARALPPGLAGIVFRHDSDPNREGLGRALAALCRRRRMSLVVAGDTRLARRLGAGVHLRGGRWPTVIRANAFVTSSAHSRRDLFQARRSGVDIAFLSPAFPTASHPGAPGLGSARWCLLARGVGLTVGALGGVDGRSVRRLAGCSAAGAIGALAP
jgi:thiamine-phosphate pyrophosphorylase